jgi:squalene cyclase
MDIGKQLLFIEENGSDLEKARFRQFFYGVRPAPEAIQPFMELQNRDGGFPCHMLRGNPSAIHKTVNALSWLDDLGMLRSSTADKALSYLLGVQREDGGWDETAALAQYGVPPWATPGDLRARLYLTAQSAFWMAVRGDTAEPALHRALDFLLKHRDETGRFHGFLHSTWIATSAFAAAGPQGSLVVREGLQVLLARPLAEWVDSQIAWALECLGRAGVPRSEPFVRTGLSELVRRQEDHGKWVSEDGEAYSVNTAIGVLKVLKHYGLVEDG